MLNRPLIVIEDKIPFIKGRFEPYAEVRYLHPDQFRRETVADADAMIVRTRTRCNAELLADTKIKFIATATIGTDHIDMQWCHSAGIDVQNAPGCNAPAVAQYVWATLLCLNKNPLHTTIGIVGCGNVGSIVAQWGRMLGVNVLICDPPKAELAKPDEKQNFMTLEEMLPLCDVVTLHTPLTTNGAHPTFHLIGERQLSMMRDGSTLINAARGPVVDTRALISICPKRNISLAIDCWEGEPDINLELLHIADIATPHIAGYSLQGKQRATRMSIESTFRFLKDNNFIEALTEIPVKNLTPEYIPLNSLSAQQIIESYNPLSDTEKLKASPHDFERLRADYQYRNEPLE